MSRKDRILCLLVCAVFGFVGGAVSNLGLLNVKSAEAQQATVVRAQRFEVVDSSGNRQAELGLDKNGGGELNIYSKALKSRSTLTEDHLYFYDRNGVYAWP